MAQVIWQTPRPA